MRNIRKEYLAYLKDNPQGFWFKARWYGWGWVPVTWQGWVTVAVWLVLVLALSFTVDESSPPQEIVFTFFLPLAILTGTLLRICWKKGERPHWNWGPPKKDE